jgi:hypothetical protein
MVISISGGSVGNDGLLRNQNRLHLRQHRRHDHHRRQPRQRRSDDRRVDLVSNLRGDVGFDGRLIDSVGEAPAENLILRQVRIRRERTAGRSERRAAVAGAAVLILSAVAPPVGGDDDIGESAFDFADEKAFDDPEDGHKLAGFEGLDAGGEFLDGFHQHRNKVLAN